MVAPALTDIKIPAQLLPLDGRFGSGPSKIRAEQIDAVVGHRATYLARHIAKRQSKI
jgi:phosphoserine aminotransferase